MLVLSLVALVVAFGILALIGGLAVRELRRDLRIERGHHRFYKGAYDTEQTAHRWTREALKTAGTASAVLVRSGERVEVEIDSTDMVDQSRRATIRRAKERARERADMRTGHYGDDNGNPVPDAVANQPRKLTVFGDCPAYGCVLSAGHVASHLSVNGFKFDIHDEPPLTIDREKFLADTDESIQRECHRSGCALDTDHKGPCETARPLDTLVPGAESPT